MNIRHQRAPPRISSPNRAVGLGGAPPRNYSVCASALSTAGAPTPWLRPPNPERGRPHADHPPATATTRWVEIVLRIGDPRETRGSLAPTQWKAATYRWSQPIRAVSPPSFRARDVARMVVSRPRRSTRASTASASKASDSNAADGVLALDRSMWRSFPSNRAK